MRRTLVLALLLTAAPAPAQWTFGVSNGAAYGTLGGFQYSTSNSAEYEVDDRSWAHFSSGLNASKDDVSMLIDAGADSELRKALGAFLFSKFQYNRIASSTNRLDSGAGAKLTFCSSKLYAGSFSAAPVWTNADGDNSLSASLRLKNDVSMWSMSLSASYWLIFGRSRALQMVDVEASRPMSERASLFASYSWTYDGVHDHVISLGYSLRFK